MQSSSPIAVVGATGQQGSATVNALLDRGLPIRALTRHVDSDAAKGLAGLGAEVVEADLADPASIRRAFEGAAAAFAMTAFRGYGFDGEVAQGKVIGDAAKAAGLPFLVYTSIAGVDRNSGVAHFESKARIEEYLRGVGLALNVIRPPFFMENLIRWNTIGRNDQGWAVRLALPADVPLQMVATRDIGRVAAALIAQHDPDAEPIEIAGDDVTGQRLTALVSQRVKESAHFVQLP